MIFSDPARRHVHQRLRSADRAAAPGPGPRRARRGPRGDRADPVGERRRQHRRADRPVVQLRPGRGAREQRGTVDDPVRAARPARLRGGRVARGRAPAGRGRAQHVARVHRLDHGHRPRPAAAARPVPAHRLPERRQPRQLPHGEPDRARGAGRPPARGVRRSPGRRTGRRGVPPRARRLQHRRAGGGGEPLAVGDRGGCRGRATRGSWRPARAGARASPPRAAGSR